MISFKLFRKNVVTSVLISTLVFSLNGCIYLVVGGLGALGGYVVSPDTVEGVVQEHTEEEVWAAAVEVVSIMGVITDQNEQIGILVAKVNGVKVSISVMPNDGSTRITIKARKAFLPKVRLAQDIYIKIARFLKDE